MTDIYTTVAQEAWRNGRTTRMTEDAAMTEQRLEFLASLLRKTLDDAAAAEAYAKQRYDYADYLRAIIDRERVDPTHVVHEDEADPPVGNGSTLSGPTPAVPPAQSPGPLDKPTPPAGGRDDDPAAGGAKGGGLWT